MRRRLGIAIAVIVCATALLIALCSLPGKIPPAGDALLAAADGLDAITIDAAFDPDSNSLIVSQSFTLINRTGEDQTEIVLRTYAAAFREEAYAPSATEELYDLCYPNGFSAGSITIAANALDLDYTDEAHTVLTIALDTVWEMNTSLEFTLDYTLKIPNAAYRFGYSDGIYALGNVFLIPAAYLDNAWRTDEYYSIGNPFVSECRNYTVHLTLPQGYTAAGTGTAVTEEQTTTFSALASRDFALSISKEYQSVRALQGDVLIETYARTAAHAKAMLSIAQKAMKIYSELYGTYPYPALTLAETDIPFDGASYPSFTMIGSTVLAMNNEAREISIAREIAKQWFAEVIGTDAFNQSWQYEALAEYALLDYWQAQHGLSAWESLQYSRIDTAMRLSVADLTPGSPLDYFYRWGEYQTVVWHRGAAVLCALNLAMEGRLDEFLAAYYDTYAFTIATRADFEQALHAFTKQDWTPLLTDYLDTIY